MKKFINDPQNVTDELLEGFAAANKDLVTLKERRLTVSNALAAADRVTVVGMGGSGHEPAPIGFVGEGMLDVAISGNIFVAPEEDIAIKALELADKGKGVIFVVLNHEGDLLTGERATAACRARGIEVREIITQEDISSAPRSHGRDRRGLVGCILLYKIVGAAAAMGKSVEETAAVGQRFADQMATLTVGVRGATHPVTGKLLAEFGEDDMEIGMGQHGEEGGGRTKLKTADETAEIMLEALLRDLGIRSGERIMLVLDGMGATTMMELFIVYRRCASYLKEKNIEIAANYIGNLLTVQEAAGFQMFIARMDDELLTLWNAPCSTPYFKR
ncbi:MAG: dihydroxyacetone kinase subunit DhaK [Lachnospiraceae bacterium]|jgi:dihydroxyacetone kinase-like protein|nr:dihydroxyacetone kinase subunit DhaK [Lachnospiraceae bacterium]MCI1727513.1 dihydroxyacetone kinase subunit DhaK [Lachnospiraceae bacterium]